MKDFGKQKNNFSNLPQEAVMKKYPEKSNVSDSDIDDSMSGIDKSINSSVSKVKSHKSYQK
jgi:hypothetical protein